MRNTFVNTLYERAKTNKNIIMMCGDLGYGVLAKFYDHLPEQFINAGISEQNMTSAATGMALNGDIVFTYSIANFPSLRCLEQIRNDVAYHNANVNIVSVGAGLAYGSSGMSHHAVDDVTALRGIPNMNIFCPADPMEASAVVDEVLNIDGPCYIRLGKGGEKNIYSDNQKLDIRKAIPVLQGGTIAIIASGAICEEALLASEILAEQGIKISIYSVPMIKPMDISSIQNILNTYETVYTLEEHTIAGGFGSAIAEILAEYHANCRFHRFGIQDEFTSEVGSQKYLRDFYGISANKIASYIEKDVRGML